MVIAVYLEHEVPIFSPTEEQIGRFRARLGPGAEVAVCRSEPEFLAALPRAELAVVWTFRQEWFALAPRLRAVCTPAAGRDYFRVVPPPGVELRYGSFHGAIMGETAAACVLALSHGVLPFSAEAGEPWPRPAFAVRARRLAGATVLILGFGRIGRAASDASAAPPGDSSSRSGRASSASRAARIRRRTGSVRRTASRPRRSSMRSCLSPTTSSASSPPGRRPTASSTRAAWRC